VETLHLKAEKHRRILQGHLWAFAGEIAEDIKQFQPGDAVVLCESRGRVLGRGYVNPHSLIAVRLLTRGDEPWDDSVFKRRFSAAKTYRDEVCQGWEARREVYAESDGVPGLIVDRYGKHLVIQSLTAGIERRLEEVVAALIEVYEPESIIAKGGSPFREQERLPEEDRVLYGTLLAEIGFNEEGVRFTAHPLEGQKSGFYLDQRTNRNLILPFVKGKRVLDLFSYTGAWGIRALAAGAREAVMVDSAAKAVAWGMEDATANGISNRAVFVEADVGEFLTDADKRGEKWDVVILDPPALIRSRTSLEQGVKAYRALNQAALKVVTSGGYLVSCSCSHLMSREKHLEVIGEAGARLGRSLRVVASGGHPPDHPILPGHPETEYLKCWIVHCE